MPTDHPTLDYGGQVPSKWVSLRKFNSDFEAQLVANRLEAAGIRHQIFNDAARNAFSGLYAGLVPVDLQVLNDDLERARSLLAQQADPGSSDYEPAEPDDPARTLSLPDEDGTPADWAAVSAFESAAALHEAAMVLEAAHMAVLVPKLVHRGDAPPGEGPRFVLRVQSDDVDRARSLLRSAAAEEESDELRCPRCGSWNVHDHSQDVTHFFRRLFGSTREPDCECLKCHFVGKPAEFAAR